MIIETMTNTNTLWKINRHREHFKVALQKRKAIGYCIKILVVIGIGIICWWIRP